MAIDIRIVLVTIPKIEEAENLSALLVEKRLAACVNILPSITSVFEWEGGLSKDKECLMIIKTISSRIAPLEKEIIEKHPYQVPEFIVIEAENVNEAYAKWLRTSVRNETYQ